MKERSLNERFEHLGYLARRFDRQYFGGYGKYLLRASFFLAFYWASSDQVQMDKEIIARVNDIPSIQTQKARTNKIIQMRGDQVGRINRDALLLVTGLMGSVIGAALTIREGWQWYQHRETHRSIPLSIRNFVYNELDDSYIDRIPGPN